VGQDRGYCVLAQDSAVPEDLIITAVLPNPQGTDSKAEWIEVYNNSNQDINLKDYTLIINDKETNITQEDFTMQTNSFVYLARNPEIFVEEYPELIAIKLNKSLTNQETNLSISTQTFTYKNTQENIVTQLDINCNKYEEIDLDDFVFEQLLTGSCETEIPQEQESTTQNTSLDQQEQHLTSIYHSLNKQYSSLLDARLPEISSTVSERAAFEIEKLPTLDVSKTTPANYLSFLALNLALVGIYLEFLDQQPIYKLHQYLKHLAVKIHQF
jgi:hypothetical protein